MPLWKISGGASEIQGHLGGMGKRTRLPVANIFRRSPRVSSAEYPDVHRDLPMPPESAPEFRMHPISGATDALPFGSRLNKIIPFSRDPQGSAPMDLY